VELDASRNRFGFTGYLFDRETSLFFAKARFHDPQVGRFTSQDSFLGSMEHPPSLHRYFYASANPTRYIDPTGHAAQDAQFEDLLRRERCMDASGKTQTLEYHGTGVDHSKFVGVSGTPSEPGKEHEMSLDQALQLYREANAPNPQVVQEAVPDEKPSLLRRALTRASEALSYVPKKAQEIAQDIGTAVFGEAFGAHKPQGSLTDDEIALGRDADLVARNRLKRVQESLANMPAMGILIWCLRRRSVTGSTAIFSTG
jgi:RHS repeat-associated protein